MSNSGSYPTSLNLLAKLKFKQLLLLIITLVLLVISVGCSNGVSHSTNEESVIDEYESGVDNESNKYEKVWFVHESTANQYSLIAPYGEISQLTPGKSIVPGFIEDEYLYYIINSQMRRIKFIDFVSKEEFIRDLEIGSITSSSDLYTGDYIWTGHGNSPFLLQHTKDPSKDFYIDLTEHTKSVILGDYYYFISKRDNNWDIQRVNTSLSKDSKSFKANTETTISNLKLMPERKIISRYLFEHDYVSNESPNGAVIVYSVDNPKPLLRYSFGMNIDKSDIEESERMFYKLFGCTYNLYGNALIIYEEYRNADTSTKVCTVIDLNSLNQYLVKDSTSKNMMFSMMSSGEAVINSKGIYRYHGATPCAYDDIIQGTKRYFGFDSSVFINSAIFSYSPEDVIDAINYQFFEDFKVTGMAPIKSVSNEGIVTSLNASILFTDYNKGDTYVYDWDSKELTEIDGSWLPFEGKTTDGKILCAFIYE